MQNATINTEKYESETFGVDFKKQIMRMYESGMTAPEISEYVTKVIGLIAVDSVLFKITDSNRIVRRSKL